MYELQMFIGVKLTVAFQFHGGVIGAVERSQHFEVKTACPAILQKWLAGVGRQLVRADSY